MKKILKQGKKIVIYKHKPTGAVFETISQRPKRPSSIEGWQNKSQPCQAGGQGHCIKEDIGKRYYMEDRHVIAEKGGLFMYAIFDGHSSSKMSSYLEQNFPNFLLNRVLTVSNRSPTEIKEKIRRAFLDFDSIMFNERIKGGSTSIVVLRIKNVLYFANLGDSRAIVNCDGKLTFETIDHKPEKIRERARIYSSGGFVANVRGIHRVNGSYSLSRAFGDYGLKKKRGKYMGMNSIMSPEPDVYDYKMSKKCSIILACDGVWDVLDSKEVVKLIRDKKVVNSCDKILNEAIRKGSTDNITIMIVPLRIV